MRVHDISYSLIAVYLVGYTNFVVLQVKFGLSITSSEKADKEKRYCDFDLYSVPYPGM